MTPERLARGKELVARYPRAQSALIPFLQYCQEQDGYVTPRAIEDAAQIVGITPGEVESIASFYTLLFRQPVGRHVIQVCRTLSCMLRDAEVLQDHIKRKLGIGHRESSADGQFYYEEVECLAACDRAPCLQHNLEFHYDVTPVAFDSLLERWRVNSPASAMSAE